MELKGKEIPLRVFNVLRLRPLGQVPARLIDDGPTVSEGFLGEPTLNGPADYSKPLARLAAESAPNAALPPKLTADGPVHPPPRLTADGPVHPPPRITGGSPVLPPQIVNDPTQSDRLDVVDSSQPRTEPQPGRPSGEPAGSGQPPN
jgi:hypothetical protein